MKEWRIFFTTILFLPVLAFSQGEFLPAGQSGFGLTAGLAFYEEAKGFAGGAGYSINGIFDLGLSYAKTNGYEKGIPSLSAFSPSFTFHAVKQNEKNPVNLSASVAYVFGSSSSSQGNPLTSSRGYILGGQIFTKTTESDALNVMFIAGVYVNVIETERADGDGYDEQSFKEKDTDVAFVLELPFIIPLQKSNILVISPSYSIVKDNNSINVAVSLIIPSAKNKK